MNHALTVAVTGATGFVGRSVVRALMRDGHRVRALIRDTRKARDVLPAQDDPRADQGSWTGVVGDVLEEGIAEELAAGAHAIVHTIGIRREIPPHVTFAKLHVQATEVILDAARAAGTRRFIHVSAMGVRPDAPTAYQRSKYESEMLVRRSGLEWTILRPSLIHGPDGEFMKMVKNWALGRSAPHIFMPYFAKLDTDDAGRPRMPPKLVSGRGAPVHVEDVAAAAAAALRRAESVGEVYPLSGPEVMEWPEMLATVRDALGELMGERRRKPIIGLPGRLAWAGAVAAGKTGLGALLPFGPSEPIMAMEDCIARSDKAAAHLGFRPRPFRSEVRAYAARI